MAATLCQFRAPERLIKTPDSLKNWLKSEAYVELNSWIKSLGDSVVGVKVTDEAKRPHSEIIDKLLALLEQLSKLIDETKIDEGEQRFGNKAFRTWLDKIKPDLEQMVSDLLPDNLKGAVVELVPYLREGFGNYTRIDYGTGHELKFMSFLCCLMKIQAIPQSDSKAVVLKVAVKYIELVRKLQSTYRMEPAGSHGVWGLDDFQFIPFIWGASQLIGQDDFTPSSFTDASICDASSQDYLFMSCIAHINKVKTGPFAEHSNILWGISGVADWSKVRSGLLRMYKAEVLDKLPVVQHFPFGSILSINSPPEDQ